jgi:hypothetical protein
MGRQKVESRRGLKPCHSTMVGGNAGEAAYMLANGAFMAMPRKASLSFSLVSRRSACKGFEFDSSGLHACECLGDGDLALGALRNFSVLPICVRASPTPE